MGSIKKKELCIFLALALILYFISKIWLTCDKYWKFHKYNDSDFISADTKERSDISRISASITGYNDSRGRIDSMLNEIRKSPFYTVTPRRRRICSSMSINPGGINKKLITAVIQNNVCGHCVPNMIRDAKFLLEKFGYHVDIAQSTLSLYNASYQNSILFLIQKLSGFAYEDIVMVSLMSVAVIPTLEAHNMAAILSLMNIDVIIPSTCYPCSSSYSGFCHSTQAQSWFLYQFQRYVNSNTTDILKYSCIFPDPTVFVGYAGKVISMLKSMLATSDISKPMTVTSAPDFMSSLFKDIYHSNSAKVSIDYFSFIFSDIPMVESKNQRWQWMSTEFDIVKRSPHFESFILEFLPDARSEAARQLHRVIPLLKRQPPVFLRFFGSFIATDMEPLTRGSASASTSPRSEMQCDTLGIKTYSAAMKVALYHDLRWILRQRDLKYADRPRIVVSLTTVPHRIALIEHTLRSVLDQTVTADVVYLHLPWRSRRFPNSTYEIPRTVLDLPIVVNRCEDYGPATKLIPTLDLERHPDTLIITVDDDMVFKRSLIERLLERHFASPGYAYANAGQVIDVNDEFGPVVVRSAATWTEADYPVDILEAFLGALYVRSFFDVEELRAIPEPCWSTDDIWISAHLARRGVPRVKVIQHKGEFATFSKNDGVQPLRDSNVFGVRKNDVCAALLLADFQRMWSNSSYDQYCSFESTVSSCIR